MIRLPVDNNKGIKMFNRLIGLYIGLKNTISRYKIQFFFTSIEDIVMKYLKVYIMKPNALIESEDVGFKNLGLYNLKDSVLNNMNFSERLSLFQRIRIETIHVNNCIYFSYNEKGIQPLIFTIWALGEEIRVGGFISKSLDEKIYKAQLEKLDRLLRMFKTPMFESKFNEIDRNDYFLSEIIITNMSEISIYDSVEKQNFIAQIFAVVISQNILEYIETTNV